MNLSGSVIPFVLLDIFKLIVGVMKLSLFLLGLFCCLEIFGQGKIRNVFEGVTYAVEPMEVNSENSDFGPALVGDQLLFNSLDQTGRKWKVKGYKHHLFYVMFGAMVDQHGEVVGEKCRFGNVNTKLHEGPVAYCEATGELFMTSSNWENPEKKKGYITRKNSYELKIVIAKKQQGEWKIVEEFPYNNPRYSTGHPAISSDGQVLYFTSNRPGGMGGSDIYKSHRTENGWSDPVNLGPSVNTAEGDMFPYLTDDGVLVFSSNGRGGSGGMDLFYKDMNNEASKVVNFGPSVNSAGDDFGLIIHPSHKLGYFASNREGGMGDDDIYKLRIREALLTLKGNVIDHNGNPLPEAIVQLQDENGAVVEETLSDGAGKFSFEIYKGRTYRVSGSKPFYIGAEKQIKDEDFVELQLMGEYKLELAVLDKSTKEPMPGEEVFINNSAMLTDDQGLVKMDLEPAKNYNVKVLKKDYLRRFMSVTTFNRPPGIVRDTVYMFRIEIEKTFVIENIYYEFNKWDLLPASKTELDKLVKIMNDNPELTFEMGSHTDCRGSDKYNMRLSEKRAESIIAYIVERGIDRRRIKSKGYGETQLINHCDDGIDCTEEEHRLNRRTEMKILSYRSSITHHF
ncbi:hypothetical protein EYV94_07850 [Puteibacter caeruleilacunae]|nr:hypothetical protein EYV94_07850 [Puteibacter caeruleilacunae]